MKKLHLRQLMDFYDHKLESSDTHASAINAVMGEDFAVALMCHYFKNNEKKATYVDPLQEACTTGKQKGHRLDKWICVDSIIYQVEIKNWSAHSIGGTKVKNGASSEWMIDYRKRRWGRQFNTTGSVHTPSQAGTLKVLTKMRVPELHRGREHKALLCFWEALHPGGEDHPFFSVKVSGDNFDELHVFSMSNYVRQLLKETETLEVEMKVADGRIDWLNKIYN